MLSLQRFPLQLLAYLTHHIARHRQEDQDEQRQLPTDGNHAGQVDQDQDRILEQHVKRAHDRGLDLVHITRHPCDDIPLSLLREETQRQLRDLPEPDADYVEQESQSPYGSLDEALERIKELEQQLDTALGQNADDQKTIDELQLQIDELMVYKEEEAAFEKEKEKFYEEVVFSDEAPDISEYRAYYESIDPENAEVLYKQVIEQITYDESVQGYVKTYSQMQPKDAAKIFDQMTDNLGLVADILSNMGTKTRADILAAMDVETAARLTEIMEPKK